MLKVPLSYIITHFKIGRYETMSEGYFRKVFQSEKLYPIVADILRCKEGM